MKIDCAGEEAENLRRILGWGTRTLRGRDLDAFAREDPQRFKSAINGALLIDITMRLLVLGAYWPGIEFAEAEEVLSNLRSDQWTRAFEVAASLYSAKLSPEQRRPLLEIATEGARELLEWFESEAETITARYPADELIEKLHAATEHEEEGD